MLVNEPVNSNVILVDVKRIEDCNGERVHRCCGDRLEQQPLQSPIGQIIGRPTAKPQAIVEAESNNEQYLHCWRPTQPSGTLKGRGTLDRQT